MAGYVATAQTDVAAAPERVWAALTEPEQIAAYMEGSKVTTTWEVGSPITWDGEYEGRAYQDKGEVLDLRRAARPVGHPLQPDDGPAGRAGELPHARLHAHRH